MAEKAFESKFNQLVQNELSQKFPAALPARIGFQLIDRKELPDGGEKAVGVTALQANNIRAYIPAVFRDNEIKGLDLMWLYEPDLFVPATGDWLKRLSDPGAQITPVGEALARSEESGRNAPDNTIISHSFFLSGKNAEKEGVRHMTENTFIPEIRDILMDMEGFGTDKTAEVLTNPDVANKVLEKFGEKYLEDLLTDIGLMKEAAVFVNSSDTEEQASVQNMGRVLVIDGPGAPGAETLDDNAKKLLMKNEAYVRDDRDPASLGQLYRTKPNSSMKVPDKSGVYDLMTVDGPLRRCLVIFGHDRERRDGRVGMEPGPGKSSAGSSEVLVVPLDASDTAWKINARDLFGAVVDTVGTDDNKTLGKKADDSIFSTRGTVYVAQPHRWLELHPNRDMEGKSDNTFLVSTDKGDRCSCTVRFTGRTGEPEIVGNVLFLPLNSRVFKTSDKKLNLASWDASAMVLFKEAGCSLLRVARMAGGWQIQHNGTKTPVMDKTAALTRLSVGMKIYGGASQMLLKEAEREGMAEYMYKEAAEDVGNAGNVPYNLKTPTKTRTTAKARGLDSNQRTVQGLMEAAESGEEDIFELDIIKNLLEARDSRELNKDTLDELTGAMDACGRNLYRMYWEGADSTREGSMDQIRARETKLLTLFEALGDAVLDLQEQRSDKKG